MFIEIRNKYIFVEELGNKIQPIEKSFFLNLNKVGEIEFGECVEFVSSAFTTIKLINYIEFNIVVEEGILTLKKIYFAEESIDEYQKIKKMIKSKTLN